MKRNRVTFKPERLDYRRNLTIRPVEALFQMSDPAEAGDIRPVNRIAAFFDPVPGGGRPGDFATELHARLSAISRLRTQLTGGSPEDVVPEHARNSSPEMDALAERWEFEEAYRLWYELARSAVDERKDPDAIRSEFLDIAENSGATANAVREALDDALGGRPPKYEFPLSP